MNDSSDVELNSQGLPIPSPFGPTPPPPPLRLIEKPDRGLSLITTAGIKRGQVVLVDSPLVIFPMTSALPLICSYCFRTLPSEPLLCTKCKVARFCSDHCLSRSHPSLLCHALPSLATGNYAWPNDLIYLLSVYSLPSSSISLLLSLSSNSRESDEYIEILHAQLTFLISGQKTPLLFSRKNTYSLISKERRNLFRIPTPENQFERFEAAGIPHARACALYSWASILNHDCMPNVCRFVYVDGPQADNTNLIFRALHDIEKGSEITTSYLEFFMDYQERQEELQKVYGFTCKCDRCKIESQWMCNQEKQEEGKEDKKDYEDKKKEVGVEKEEALEMSDDYIEYFFDQFVCDCGGFLAPLPPSQDGVVSDVMECNGCGSFDLV